MVYGPVPPEGNQDIPTWTSMAPGVALPAGYLRPSGTAAPLVLPYALAICCCCKSGFGEVWASMTKQPETVCHILQNVLELNFPYPSVWMFLFAKYSLCVCVQPLLLPHRQVLPLLEQLIWGLAVESVNLRYETIFIQTFISSYFNSLCEKCSQNIQFGTNQTLSYSGNIKKKFSKWHFWDKESLGCHSPAQDCPCRCTLTRLGLVQLVSIVKQKNNSGKWLFWKRGHTDVRGELKKEAFQQDNTLCLSTLSNESLFHKVYRNGRTLLPLKLGFSGLRVSGPRVTFASVCSRVLCCTSTA